MNIASSITCPFSEGEGGKKGEKEREGREKGKEKKRNNEAVELCLRPTPSFFLIGKGRGSRERGWGRATRR